MKIWLSDEFEAWAGFGKGRCPHRLGFLTRPVHMATQEVEIYDTLRPCAEQARRAKANILLTGDEIERYIKWA